MGRGTVYPFILSHLLNYARPYCAVLETGCGGAAYRNHLKDRNCRYIGTDVVNPHYQNPGDVDVLCSADRLPFGDCMFDVVFNQGAIDYMPDTLTTLREARRVLKRNGVLLIYTYTEAVLKDIHANCLVTARPWEKHHTALSEADLLDLLAAAQFEPRDVSGALDTWSPASGLAKAFMKLSGQLARVRLRNSIWRAYLGRRMD